MVDLHAHTTASDGSLNPTELMTLGKESGLAALAVTDHDTVDGLAEAESAARNLGIEFVPGIELALDCPTGRFHMLGLLIDYMNPILIERLKLLKANRARRNYLMIEKLAELGVPIDKAEVDRIARGGQIGRPHLAQAMIRKGYVSSVKEAFKLYLQDGAAAHVPKDKISVEEGIALIHAAGGLAIIAHPNTLKLEDSELAVELIRLKQLGLDGIEAYYNLHSESRNQELADMAQEAGLLISGGSDFHGDAKPDVKLGHVLEESAAPDWILESLKSAQRARFQ